MQIGGLQKLTLIDYPGKTACTVFVLGCPFRCPFCYSSELVLPEKMKDQPRIPEEEFFEFLEDRRGLLDGVVICGGEPCLNDDLPEFAGKIREMGFLVKLDTNGYYPEMIRRLMGEKLLDYVAMDIKGPKEQYGTFSGIKGIDVTRIEESMKLLIESGIGFEFRTTVCPGLAKEDLESISKWIVSLAGEKKAKYFLQEFEKGKETISPELVNERALGRQSLDKIAKEIAPQFQVCQVRP